MSGGQEHLKPSPGAPLRRDNAEVAAGGDFGGGVVEHIGRAFGEDAVASRFCVGAEAQASSILSLRPRASAACSKSWSVTEDSS